LGKDIFPVSYKILQKMKHFQKIGIQQPFNLQAFELWAHSNNRQLAHTVQVFYEEIKHLNIKNLGNLAWIQRAFERWIRGFPIKLNISWLL
jgi:hypothetical protein